MLNRSMNIYKVLIMRECGSNTINCQDHEIVMSKRPSSIFCVEGYKANITLSKKRKANSQLFSLVNIEKR